MFRSLRLPLVAALAVAAGCSFPYADPPQTATSTTSTTVAPGSTTEPPPTTAPDPLDPSQLLGPVDRILMQTPAGVQLADAAGLHDLDPAGAPFEGQPTFSPNGTWAAWVQVAGSASAVAVVDLFGYEPGLALPEVRSSTAPVVPFYVGLDRTETRVGALGGAEEVAFTIGALQIDAAPGFGPVVDQATPLFPAWGPDDLLAMNLGGELQVRDGFGTLLRSHGETAGAAPVWLADGRLVHLSADAEIVAIADDPRTGTAEPVITSLTPVGGFARLFASPDGDLLAVTVEGSPASGASPVAFQQNDPDEPAEADDVGLTDGVWVLDPADGSATQLLDRPVQGVFWAPTNDRLLIAEANDGLVWSVVDLVGTVLDQIGPVVPSETFAANYVPFLDQYAQSITLWSPDGSRFVSPERFGNAPHLVIHAVGQPGQRAVLGAGEMAVWAPLSR